MTRRVRTQRGRADPSRGAYERSDIDAKAASLTIVGLAGLVIVVALGVALLLLGFGRLRQPAAPAPQLIARAPALQVNEHADRLAIEARARRRLGDAAIDSAMQQTVQAGWDAPR